MKAIYVGVTDLLQVGGAWRVLRLTRLSESRADLEVASVDDVRSTPHSEFTACLDVSTVVSSDVVAAWQNDPLGVDEFRACGAKQ